MVPIPMSSQLFPVEGQNRITARAIGMLNPQLEGL
jgi:hypothetical protein